MIDQFENTAVSFEGELPDRIKAQIRDQLERVPQGAAENLDGYNRGKYLLSASKLTGLEMKRLMHDIEDMPRDAEGRITDPAYLMIGGDALNTFLQTEMKRLRHQINSADEMEKELGKTEKQDINPSRPPSVTGMVGIPTLTGNLTEEINRIKQLIQN